TTLERVQAGIEAEDARRKILAPPRLSRPAVRWGDLISVAALFLIASAVITPMVGAVRGYAQQRACFGGMGSTANAFGSYANDFREALPMASSSQAGLSWWNVGQPEQ